MRTLGLRQQKGFSLLDAAIAAIILGVGVLGLSALNGRLLQGTGLSKTRAEAVQVAQTHLEEARRVAAASGCSDLPDVPDAATGVNANYAISVAYLGPDTSTAATSDDYEDEIKMAMQVSWDDGNTDPTDSQIILTSTVNCHGTSISDSGLATTAPTLLPPLKTPTGRGKIGGPEDIYDLEDLPDTVFDAEHTIPRDEGEGPADGTYTYTHEGRVELIEKTYDDTGELTGAKVLLGFDELCAGEDFSTVSGKLFVQMKNDEPIVAESDLFLLGSDASYCAVLPYDGNDDNSYDNVLGDNAYLYVEYQCYFAPEWWGNTGVVRTGSVSTNDRVCVGRPSPADDPFAEYVDTAFSKEPELSTTRGYRAYEIGDNGWESVGIGYNESGCGNYSAVQFTDHHFVLTNLTGGSSCETAETDLDLLSDLGDNPGPFFCMADDPDGVDCPDIPGTIEIPKTTVHGTITFAEWSTSATDWILTGIDEPGGPGGGGTCLTSSLADDGSTTTYECQIDWVGFSGESWYGNLAFTAADGSDASLCMAGSTVSVLPNTETVDYVINDRFADLAGDVPNAISFTDIPRTVTDVELNFEVKYDWCGLGTPNVSWSWDEILELPILSWPAVYDARSYLVETCTEPNKNELTPCTSGWSSSTISASDQEPPYTYDVAVGTKDTICVQVTAQKDSFSGTTSPVKCVWRSANGTTYSYQ